MKRRDLISTISLIIAISIVGYHINWLHVTSNVRRSSNFDFEAWTLDRVIELLPVLVLAIAAGAAVYSFLLVRSSRPYMCIVPAVVAILIIGWVTFVGIMFRIYA